MTEQANFDAYMDTSESTRVERGDRVQAETPPPCQWSNGEQTPGRNTEPEEPRLWDEWAIDMEYRIQDVREYTGAVEKVLLSKVEGLLNQTKMEKRFLDQRLAQMQRSLTE